MIAKEAFEIVIGVIEEKVLSRSLDIWEPPIDEKRLCDEAFNSAGCEFINQRGRNVIFKFLVGMTISQYINQRILMRTYQVLLQEEQYNLSPLMNIMGLSSEPSVYKKFKEYFKMTPKEAFERKIEFLYIPAYEWEMVSPEGQTFLFDAIEVNKGVPVFVKKLDKRAYVIVASIIMGVVLLVGTVIFLYRFFYPWMGDYVVFINGMNNQSGEMISCHQNDAFFKFNLWDRKIEVTVKDLKTEYEIDSIGFRKISYHDPVTNKGGEWSATYSVEDKCIWVIPEEVPEPDYNGYSILYYSLLKTDLYEKTKENWDGFYQVYGSDEKSDELISTNIYLSVSIDCGMAILISEETMEMRVLSILLRDENAITTFDGITFIEQWGNVFFESKLFEDDETISYYEAKRID